MLKYDHKVRVRYGETDKMGYLYYGIYAQYYEVGRAETMRHLGFSYAKLENEYKIMMPVKSMKMRFVRPARYDELVTIRTILKDLPTDRVVFRTEIYNEAGKIMNAGEVRLVFVNMETGQTCSPPQILIDCVKPYFEAKTDTNS